MGYPEFAYARSYMDIQPKWINCKSSKVQEDSSALLQATLDAADNGIIIVDLAQKVCYYNYNFIEMWKLSEAVLKADGQHNVVTLLAEQLKNPEEYREEELQLYNQPEIERYCILELKDERMFEYYSRPQWLNGRIVGRVLSFRDITKQKVLEKKIAHLERLHIIGEMAAGIGHEVRNPLTTIRGLLQMLTYKKEGKQYQDYYHLMIEELDRVNLMITEFLSLAKEKAISLYPLNINNIVSSLLPLMEADAIVSNKYVKAELVDIPEILADGKEIRQLILNLVRNSLDAMAPGKYVTIKTYTEEERVVLAIEDQGTGIKPEVLKNIGKSFFTTKEHGTGLGLAICYNIAAKHHATMQVKTSTEGTTFFVTFNQYCR